MGLEILPGEWEVQATHEAPQSWGLTTGLWVPLTGLKTSGTYSRVVRSLNSAREVGTQRLPYSSSEGGGSRQRCPGPWPVSHEHLSGHHCPSSPGWAPHKGEGCCCWGECILSRDRGCSDLSLHLTGLKVPTAALTEMTDEEVSGTLFSQDHPVYAPAHTRPLLCLHLL